MAKKRFKKGDPGGPGRPKMSEEEKRLSKLTRTAFNKIVRKYLQSSRPELAKLAKSPNTSTLDLIVISVMNKAIKTGDEKKMNWFLEQLFGKLQENLKVSGAVDSKTEIDLKRLSREELNALLIMVDRCNEPE